MEKSCFGFEKRCNEGNQLGKINGDPLASIHVGSHLDKIRLLLVFYQNTILKGEQIQNVP